MALTRQTVAQTSALSTPDQGELAQRAERRDRDLESVGHPPWLLVGLETEEYFDHLLHSSLTRLFKEQVLSLENEEELEDPLGWQVDVTNEL